MFTGIITNKGTITEWHPSRDGGRIHVRPEQKYKHIKMGESIALNGCCLTVVGLKNNVLEFDLSDETIRKTAFLKYREGQVLNMERAMRASDALGGHFVLGHVDSTGRVVGIKKNQGSVAYQISYPKKFSHLLIEKGSVAVDGISLTVCNLKETRFDLYIIPHTLKETGMPFYKTGDLVNLEYDVLGKYVYRQGGVGRG